MSLSVVIFGAGRFGSAVANELFRQNVEVMVVDRDFEKIQDIATKVTTAIQCDLEDESAVAELGLSNFDVAIVAIGTDLEASIISAMIAKDYKIPRIIAKASSDMQARILEKLGADQIIFPELDMGTRLARSVSGHNILEYIRLSNKYSMVEIKADPSWLNKNLVELDFRNRYHLNVVAIKRGNDIIISNLAGEKILQGDELILIGENKSVEGLQKS